MKAYKKELTMMGVLIALVLFAGLLTPKTFLNAENLSNDLRLLSLLLLFSLGEAVVIISGGIDLSLGSIITLTACGVAWLTTGHGMGIVPAVIIVLAVDVVIGLLQGLAIARIGVQPFVITLGGMFFIRGLADMITRGQEIGLMGRFPGFSFLGQGDGLGLPIPFWFAVVITGATVYLMHRTKFGRFCYAIGSNAEAARLSGVPVAGTRVMTYVMSAALAGIAGLLYAGYVPAASPSLGNTWELDAVTAVVLGGCSLLGGRGSVLGTIPGAGILIVEVNAVDHLANPLWGNVVRGGVLLIAVIVDRIVEKK
jgi:ribose transport system permease protein